MVQGTLTSPKTSNTSYLSLLRVSHWSKNFLILLPLLTAHQFTDLHKIFDCLLGIISFSLIASSGYIINDLFDQNSDRLHPHKKHRPIASHTISTYQALWFLAIIMTTGFILSLLLNLAFTCLLLGYFILTFTYSKFIKKWFLFDILMLVSLFLLRIYAGGLITNIPLSHWLIFFAIGFFMGLACIKRITELNRHPEITNHSSHRRYYRHQHQTILYLLGSTSSLVALSTLYTYINSYDAKQLYQYPAILMVSLFLITCWLGTIWIKTTTKKIHDDPILFALRDKASIVLCSLILISVVLAI